MTARPTRLNPRVTNVDLTASSPPRSRPTVRNRAKLARFETALATKARPVITVVGNSISWGVGSDGTGTTTTGFYETYRQNAWPVLLRKMFAARQGVQPCENFIGAAGLFTYVSNPTNGAAPYGSTGPFGSMTGVGGSGGGVHLPSASATIDIAAARTGVFTELDVIFPGSAAGATGRIPRVLIDDVEVLAGGGTSTANIEVITITGLSESSHKITLQGAGSSGDTHVTGVVTRRSSGVIVNRIAVPGAKASDVIGASAGFNTTQQHRVMDAAVLAGYSDLVILQFTANEVYGQVSLSSYQSDVQAIVDRATTAGACVLLLADPMVTNEETNYAIKGSQYRAVLQAISDATAHVSYADQNAIFGDRASGEAMGMWPSGTVHPALEGHRRMADFVFRDVLPVPSIESSGSGIFREIFTTAEKSKLSGVATGATANSAEAAAATASTLALRDAYGNLTADAFIATKASTATAATTTTLTIDSAQVQEFTGSTTQTVLLPTTSVTAGTEYRIINSSSGVVTVQSSGANTITTLAAGTTAVFIALQDTPTAAAHWSARLPWSAISAANTTAARDASATLAADMFIPGFTTTATAAGTTTLTVDSTEVQVFTGSSGQTVVLPTTGIAAGHRITIVNLSTASLTLNASGGGNWGAIPTLNTTIAVAKVATPTVAADWSVSFASTNNAFRTSATASSVAVRDSSANLVADQFVATKTATATAGTTTTLTIDSTQCQEFTGSTTQTVKLPTTSVTAGLEYRIINNSSGTVTVQSSGANTIDTVAAGFTKLFMAQVDTPTTAANWRVFTPSA